jgi:hypothetical protein
MPPNAIPTRGVVNKLVMPPIAQEMVTRLEFSFGKKLNKK